jgi:hypothetical protein
MDVDDPDLSGQNPYYKLTPGPYQENEQVDPMAIEAFVPRTISPPFSNWNTRIGVQSPGAGVMALGLQLDVVSKPQPQPSMAISAGSYTETLNESFAGDENVPPYDAQGEETALEWTHQLPESAFGLPTTTDDRSAIPGASGGTRMSHSVSQSSYQSSSVSTCRNKGGRRTGFRLSEDGASSAKEMRRCGACWHCFLMRKKVTYLMRCKPQWMSLMCKNVSVRVESHVQRAQPLRTDTDFEFGPSVVFGTSSKNGLGS